jgi:hypothetical protein
LESCQQKLRQSKQNVSLEKNSCGLILKIGNRRSNHYFRIYEGKNFLKFESEMKGKFLQKYYRLLVNNQVEEFENKLANQFLFYSSTLFSLYYPYLDWLVLKLRPTRYSLISSSFLNTDYIKLNSFSLTEEKKEFILMLQFLSYAKLFDFEIEVLSGIPYRVVEFRLDHFLKFQNPNLKSINYYQLKIFFISVSKFEPKIIFYRKFSNFYMNNK